MRRTRLAFLRGRAMHVELCGGSLPLTILHTAPPAIETEAEFARPTEFDEIRRRQWRPVS